MLAASQEDCAAIRHPRNQNHDNPTNKGQCDGKNMPSLSCRLPNANAPAAAVILTTRIRSMVSPVLKPITC